ncbi:MAG TPA: patatin-like phospholipase family protein, partial [Candidatus Polarisedimenticolia bacterium]|nr:patatin-like phospholipase family protein [Candidatus Polarisedimenticolia bacterium]
MVVPTGLQDQRPSPARLTLVLGAGGVRGIAHIGVLQALTEVGVKADAIVGTSSGALVAAAHAALGWPVDRMAEYTARLGPGWVARLALQRPWLAGAQPLLALLNGEADRFSEGLAKGSFQHLHHDIRYLGVTAVDLLSRTERFFVTGENLTGISLEDAVLGSASLPILFPGRRVETGGARLHLVDGGLSATLAIGRAFGPPVSSTAVLAVDLCVATGWNERSLSHQADLLAKHSGR